MGEVSGICSGFAQSENVNALDHQSYAHWKPIPRLWHLSDWDHPLPFDNDAVCRVTFQNCPLTKTMMEEAARIVKPDGQIDLWVGRRTANEVGGARADGERGSDKSCSHGWAIIFKKEH